MVAAGFNSYDMNGPLPYVRRHNYNHIKNVLTASLNKTFLFFVLFHKNILSVSTSVGKSVKCIVKIDNLFFNYHHLKHTHIFNKIKN